MGQKCPQSIKTRFQNFLKLCFVLVFFTSPIISNANTITENVGDILFGPPVAPSKNISEKKIQNLKTVFKNSDEYVVEYDDYYLGQATINTEGLNNFVSLNEILESLHAQVTDTAIKGVIRVRMPSGKVYSIDTLEHEISTESKLRSLNILEHKILNGDYYIEVNSFISIFDIPLEIHNGVRKIIIKSSNETAFITQFIETGEDIYGPPVAKKNAYADNQDVEIQDPEAIIEQQFKENPNNTEEAAVPISSEEEAIMPAEVVEDDGSENAAEDVQPMPAIESKEVEGKDFPAVTDFTEDNLLVYEVRIGDLSYDSLVDVYENPINDKSAFYVSLKQFLKSVDFPIDVNASEKKAKGWFIKQDNNFDLDLNTKKLTLADKTIELSPQDYFIHKDEIFILIQNIRTWFPIDYELKYNNQILKLDPRVLLPFQEEELRRVKRNSSLTNAEKNNYPIIEEPYRMYQMPEGDVTISMEAAGKKDDPDFTTNFSTLLTGDYATFSTKTLVTGDDKQINSIRLRAERKDEGENLFDEGISEVAFGDISAVPINLVSNSDTGLGVSVSTYPITSSEQFDKTVIEGDAKPGWEAELYRNGQILSFQTVGPDGRYKFENIDVLYGENIFKIVLYGPQGEVKEEEKRILIGDNILKKGDSNYRFSVNKKNSSLAGIEDFSQPELNRFVTQGEYGFTNNLTVSTAFIIDEMIDKVTKDNVYNYFQQFDFSTEILETFQNFNFAYDYNNGGKALRHSLVSRYKETNINVTQEYYSDFENYSNSLVADPVIYDADFSLNRNINLPLLNNTNVTLNSKYNIYESGVEEPSVGLGFGSSIGGFGINNRVDINFPDTGEQNTTGLFSARTNSSFGYIRFDTRYRFIDSKPEVESVDLSLLRIFSEKTSLRFDINQQLTDDKKTEFGASYNYYLKSSLLGFTASIDTDMNYRVGASVSFSFYRDPVKDLKFSSDEFSVNGSAKAYAFLDENYNGKFDNNENVIREAEFEKGGTPLKKVGDKYSYIRNLPEYQPTEIKFVGNSLEDPSWYPQIEGYNVVSRAGVTAELAFPVVKTYELDGKVSIRGDEGDVSAGSETVSGLTVYLLDDKSKRVAEVTSEFDGYFLFEKIRPGKYFLTVSDEQIKPLYLKQEKIIEIEITKDEDFYTNNNIYLFNTNSSPISIEVEDGTTNTDQEFIGPPTAPKKEEPKQVDIKKEVIAPADDFVGPPLPPEILGPQAP